MSLDSAGATALSALFGTSTGDVSTVFGGAMSSGNSVSSTAAPKRDDSPPDKHSHRDEEEVTPARAQDIKIVAINTFDELNNLESIAAIQGVTEADLLGAMTIVDASGDTYTWDTFSPDTKFPIRMEFTVEAKEQRSTSEAQQGQAVKSNDAQLLVDDAVPALVSTSTSSKRNRRKKAAAKKHAEAAKRIVGDTLVDSSVNMLPGAAPKQDSKPEPCLPTPPPIVYPSSSGVTASTVVSSTPQATLASDVSQYFEEPSRLGCSKLNAEPSTSQAASVTDLPQDDPNLPSVARKSASNVESSTSCGDIATLPVCSGNGSSTSAQSCALAIEHSTSSKEHAEKVSEETTNDVKAVIIQTFDDLNDLEAIAAEQELTEEDLLGDMTIVDASGHSFTWDTFSPDTKFPIQMKFVKTSECVDNLSLGASDAAEGQSPAVTMTAPAKKNSLNKRQRAAAAKKKSAAAAATASAASAAAGPALSPSLESVVNTFAMPDEEHNDALTDTRGLSAMFGSSVGEVASLFGSPRSSSKSIGTSLRAQLREEKPPAFGTTLRAQIRTGKVS